MAKTKTIEVQKIIISVVEYQDDDYICITDMAKAKDGVNGKLQSSDFRK